MSRLSLRLRILILTLVVESLTLATLSAFICHRAQTQFLDSFDETLENESKVLASVLAPSAGGEGKQTDQLARIREHYAGFHRRELYQVVSSDGRVVVKSPKLGDQVLEVPPEILDGLRPGKGRAFDLWRGGDHYRAWVSRVAAPAANAARSDARELFVVCAAMRETLNDRLGDLRKYALIIGAAFLLMSIVALWFLTRWGVRPVGQLSQAVGSVTADNLQYRVDLERLPSDLRTLGTSINGFIARLERAFAREREFAANAAHELSTPVSLLKVNVQSALLHEPDAAKDRRSLEELLTDIERLERLADALLTLSEAESAPMGGADDREEIAVRPFLESMTAHFDQDACRHGVSLDLTGSNDVIVRADVAVLERILTNLIDNAIKHSRRGGTVWLSARRTNEGCEIRIADKGPGIPEKDAPLLFERFFRVDKSRSRDRGGAGLGLAITKALCESQGANIRYEPREGGGSVFVVQVPIRMKNG
ncbi:hypothetical protein AMJ85_10505 [candidate division BRC1 bacterium SM23_51]|nr:MAG: hypothetical protein AMJ85_10505 [candidate division BRC1 bacterium SM23_51]